MMLLHYIWEDDMQNELIAAIATPPGIGGIAIVRMSGQGAEQTLMRVFKPKNATAIPLSSHLLTFGNLIEGDTILDECMAVIMKKPRSYTREDVCEIHVHAGAASSQNALRLCLLNGARMAHNGEFTRRAFENGRINMSQAEAVMDMISAKTYTGQMAAMRGLSGESSQFINKAKDRIIKLSALLEAGIDFPDDVTDPCLFTKIHDESMELAALLVGIANERKARIINEGLSIVICGLPNVGKSSLFNALVQEDLAIVTQIPGTTRDIITSAIELNGVVAHISDMAGLNDETNDVVEKEGIQRAKKKAEEADCLLLVLDGSRPLTEYEHQLITASYSVPLFIYINKSDLIHVINICDIKAINSTACVFQGCALHPNSLQPFKQALSVLVCDTDSFALTSQRQITLALSAADRLTAAASAAENLLEYELCAIELHDALWALGCITGENINEKVIDQIFNDFCVGK